MNILVTGGASGLGAAITRRLAKVEENLIYFTYNKSLEAAQTLEIEVRNVRAVKCDFTNLNEVDALITRLSEFNIEVLINNAYIGEFIKNHFHKTPATDFLSDFNSNIFPTILITQSVINHFRKQKKGRIITILSAALLNTPPIGASIYVANKAYLEALTKIWATENAKYNITSNSVSPSLMLTSLTSTLDERIIEQVKDGTPLKKLLTVDEVADTIYFLTQASVYINGVNIIMNSGLNIK